MNYETQETLKSILDKLDTIVEILKNGRRKNTRDIKRKS